ncbi:MAG: hypothetical protein JSS76_06030 [Bacteroidetes bacterium]|nr:hypothetical protein [Bacteroidota bacterium]
MSLIRAIPFIAALILACTLIGCRQQPEQIRVADLRMAVAEMQGFRPWDPTACDMQQPADTLYTNLPYTFGEAETELHHRFAGIDTLPYSPETRQYLKALTMADMVYAAFSYQFLGPKYGLARDSQMLDVWQRWDTLPLSTCYDMGNRNVMSFYCTQRSVFYLRWIDTMLHIKGYTVTIPDGVHVFPVLHLAAGDFIIDPYDPAIFADSSGTYAVTYDTLVKSKGHGHHRAIATRRIYGDTRMLLSRAYIDTLRAQLGAPADEPVSSMLCSYLRSRGGDLRHLMRPCFEVPGAPVFRQAYIIPHGHNAYSIGQHWRVDGPLFDQDDIERYYIGTACR